MLSRVVVAVLLGLLGLVFGMFGTLVHTATFGSFTFPWGIIVALVALACLLTGIRLLSRGRLNAACAGLGALVAIAVLSQESFGGSVLITDSVLGWTWMGGAVVVALLVVGWPRLRAAAA
ncbi:DUF6113 family protein [Humibacter albus]|uniref:DUF6113 family protein n=1 Tax=Humibacter albus TaxID=427754 RepID=UPI0003B51AC5|nr:DUF6113 family protein [Humibacter albus]